MLQLIKKPGAVRELRLLLIVTQRCSGSPAGFIIRSPEF